MKKTLFAVLALAAVAACNKAEVVEQNPANAIAFDNAFVDNATKSVNDPSFTNDKMFTDFAVYGFVEGAVLFDGTTVTGTPAAKPTTWDYTGTQYWIAGAYYNFAAVAPMTNGGWTKTSCAATASDSPTTNPRTINTSLSFTNNGTTDLLYAEHQQVQGQAQGNEKVDFTFRHILSKVKFSFENGYNASNATIKVKDIKITNAYTTGNVALTGSTTTWSDHATSSLELAFGMATDNEATTDVAENVEVAYDFGKTYESQNELFLIPGAVPTNTVEVTDENGTTTKTVLGYKVTFKVALLVSDTLIDEYDHEVYVNFTPAPATCYDIKATITASNIDPEHDQEPIEFTVNALPDWGTATPVPAQ